MPKAVREPIQAYLTPAEREELDRVARDLGVSRSEVLRQGIRALTGGAYRGALVGLASEGVVTPARSEPGTPPASAPVAPLGEVLAGLAGQRDER